MKAKDENRGHAWSIARPRILSEEQIQAALGTRFGLAALRATPGRNDGGGGGPGQTVAGLPRSSPFQRQKRYGKKKRSARRPRPLVSF